MPTPSWSRRSRRRPRSSGTSPTSSAFPGQEALARRLTDATFADVVFFTNSGTEAIECALKTARKYHWANGEPERIDIIGFEGSFHGRSYAAVYAAGNPHYLEGFGPALPGYVQLPFGDMEALKAAIGPTTAAIIVEPVQGEGGARAVPERCLHRAPQALRRTGALLIYDEIQCGLGRTGKLFAHEWAADAAPDIMCVAKALGGGFPVGACLATAEAGERHERRLARLDLWRQSAGHGRRHGRVRRDRQAGDAGHMCARSPAISPSSWRACRTAIPTWSPTSAARAC